MGSQWMLAKQLREICDSNGVEKYPKQSANILHKIGLEYRRKSPDKQSLIQSIALMTSAIIREPDNVDEIEQDLDETWFHILQLADATQANACLNQIVGDIKHLISEMRKDTENRLNSFAKIPDDVDELELAEMQNGKIKNVVSLQRSVSDKYTKIMEKVSDLCQEIMGKAPCRFTLVGMGSLARNEITPYSDFESIIVLEDGSQFDPYYSVVLEYFRWFSTIFQIILVRLGETVLRFLAIPCLNNPFDSEHNWFYDGYTPCGICPDGFAPPACKNPLGRQTPTPNKPWTTELIKPVSEMVKYLDSDEDLKNGYHLSDILMRTCFVSGDVPIYQDFVSKVDVALSQQSQRVNSTSQRLIKQINDDLKLNDCSEVENIILKNVSLDVKRLIYRGATLFVSALGRLYQIRESSCIDILGEMLRLQCISSVDFQKLIFAVSIACEIRLRFYSERKEQSDWISQPAKRAAQTFEKMVGKKSICDAYATIWCLQTSVQKLLPTLHSEALSAASHQFNSNCSQPIDFQQNTPTGLSQIRSSSTVPVAQHPRAFCLWKHCTAIPEVISRYHLYFYDDAENLCRKYTRNQNSMQPEEVQYVLYIYICILYDTCRITETIRLLMKNIAQLRRLKWLAPLSGSYFKLASCFLVLQQPRKALKYMRKVHFYKHFHLIESNDNEMNFDFGVCSKMMKKHKKALKYFERAIRSNNNNNYPNSSKSLCRLAIQAKIDCLIELGQYDEAVRVANESDCYDHQILHTHMKKSKDFENCRQNFLTKDGDWVEAFEDLPGSAQFPLSELRKIFSETPAQDARAKESKKHKRLLKVFNSLKEREQQYYGLAKLQFYFFLNRLAVELKLPEDVVFYGQRLFREFEQTRLYSISDGTGKIKFQLAIAYCKLGNFKEALPLLLHPRTTRIASDDGDHWLVAVYSFTGYCFLRLNSVKLSLNFHTKSFDIEKKMLSREENLNGLSRKEAMLKHVRKYCTDTYRCRMIECLLTLRLFDEALYHSKQVWCGLSQFDWTEEYAKRKFSALTRLAKSFCYLDQNRYAMQAAGEGLRLALEIYECPVVHKDAKDVTEELASVLLECDYRILNSGLSWPHGYTPSIYSHLIDLLNIPAVNTDSAEQ